MLYILSLIAGVDYHNQNKSNNNNNEEEYNKMHPDNNAGLAQDYQKVANRIINKKQYTVTWHIDNILNQVKLIQKLIINFFPRT